MGPTPCQVGWGRVRVWVESGTGRGRVGVDSVSSRAGSSRGLGRVGDGSGSYWGRLRFKSGGVGSGSGWSRGRAGVVFGCQTLATNHGDVSICSGSLRFNMKVAPMLKDHLSFNACASIHCELKVTCSVCVYGRPHIEGPPQHQCMWQCHCELKVSGCQSLATNHGDVSILLGVTSFQHEICWPKT